MQSRGVFLAAGSGAALVDSGHTVPAPALSDTSACQMPPASGSPAWQDKWQELLVTAKAAGNVVVSAAAVEPSASMAMPLRSLMVDANARLVLGDFGPVGKLVSSPAIPKLPYVSDIVCSMHACGIQPKGSQSDRPLGRTT